MVRRANAHKMMWRLCHVGIGDRAATAGLVLDDGALAPARLKAARKFTRDNVGRAARRKWDDDADKLTWKILGTGVGLADGSEEKASESKLLMVFLFDERPWEWPTHLPAQSRSIGG